MKSSLSGVELSSWLFIPVLCSHGGDVRRLVGERDVLEKKLRKLEVFEATFLPCLVDGVTSVTSYESRKIGQ